MCYLVMHYLINALYCIIVQYTHCTISFIYALHNDSVTRLIMTLFYIKFNDNF